MTDESKKNEQNKIIRGTSFETTFLVTVFFCISIFLIIYSNPKIFTDNIKKIFDKKID